MKRIEHWLTKNVRTVGIAGHVNPDGDCVGCCTALLRYIRKLRPDLRADLYLGEPEEPIMFLEDGCGVRRAPAEGMQYDLFFVCDVSVADRVEACGDLFLQAGYTVCIDHHRSVGFCNENIIDSEASSSCEVLFGLLDPEQIDLSIATALYVGLVHDTGVFQYKNTRPVTLRIAADLIGHGVPFTKLIDETFNQRSYVQDRLLGYALETSELIEDGRVIVASVTLADMARYGADVRDSSSIVAELRYTKGVEIAVFFYETEPAVFKLSFRSQEADVEAVARILGGGGHMRAAGCTVKGTLDEAKAHVLPVVREAIKAYFSKESDEN